MRQKKSFILTTIGLGAILWFLLKNSIGALISFVTIKILGKIWKKKKD